MKFFRFAKKPWTRVLLGALAVAGCEASNEASCGDGAEEQPSTECCCFSNEDGSSSCRDQERLCPEAVVSCELFAIDGCEYGPGTEEAMECIADALVAGEAGKVVGRVNDTTTELFLDGSGRIAWHEVTAGMFGAGTVVTRQWVRVGQLADAFDPRDCLSTTEGVEARYQCLFGPDVQDRETCFSYQLTY